MDTENLPFLHDSLEHFPNPHICLLQVGREKCKPGYSYTNFRNMFLIHFIKSGCGTLSINQQELHLKENDAFLIRPNQLAVYTADVENPWEYYYFALNGAFAPELIQRTVFHDDQVSCTLNDDRLYHMIRDTIIGMESCKTADLFGLEQLFKFLQVLIVSPIPNNYNPVSEKPYLKYIEEAQKFIQFHYAKPIHVSDICKYFNINRSYFFRIFKKHTGLSLEEYLISYRMSQAKKLLGDTELPISTISQLVGYNNFSSFCVIFKKTFSQTPSEYRTSKGLIALSEPNGLLQDYTGADVPLNFPNR